MLCRGPLCYGKSSVRLRSSLQGSKAPIRSNGIIIKVPGGIGLVWEKLDFGAKNAQNENIVNAYIDLYMSFYWYQD